MKIFLNIVVALIFVQAINAADWGYLDESKNVLPEDWGKVDAKCNGKKQSPIDVMSGDTLFEDDLGEIEIVKFPKNANGSETWTVLNNGHTVKLTPVDTDFKWIMHPQKEEFKLLQLHFHWRGSEHLVDHQKFAGEVHLVTQSVSNPGQYSVIGFLIKMSMRDNKNWDGLIDDLPKVGKADATLTVKNFRLADFVPMKARDFFRYSGSLTTPNCDEVVEWNLVNSPVLSLSEDQLISLQSLHDKNGDDILTNSRPVQPLNERVVKRSFNRFNLKSQASNPLPKYRDELEYIYDEHYDEHHDEHHDESAKMPCKRRRKRVPKPC